MYKAKTTVSEHDTNSIEVSLFITFIGRITVTKINSVWSKGTFEKIFPIS